MNFERLDMLKPGECGVVHSYDDFTNEANSLMEMGLLEGTPVELIKYAPLGDPLEICFRGYHLSIRKDIARLITIQKS